jgi:hypothetical protein
MPTSFRIWIFRGGDVKKILVLCLKAAVLLEEVFYQRLSRDVALEVQMAAESSIPPAKHTCRGWNQIVHWQASYSKIVGLPNVQYEPLHLWTTFQPFDI